jgi:hypothetical protein
MRRLAVVLALPFALLLAAGPAAADTTGGGSGTNFFSFSETCSTSGGRTACTDTNLSVGPNGDGTNSTCLDIFSYTFSANGRQTFGSDQFGCVIGGNLTVGSDYSVALAPISISLQTCAAHKRSCTGSTDVTVSASDQLDGDVSTTTTRSTTKSGGCTIKTTINETDANLVGTMTLNGSDIAEQGFLSIVDETDIIHCK